MGHRQCDSYMRFAHRTYDGVPREWRAWSLVVSQRRALPLTLKSAPLSGAAHPPSRAAAVETTHRCMPDGGGAGQTALPNGKGVGAQKGKQAALLSKVSSTLIGSQRRTTPRARTIALAHNPASLQASQALSNNVIHHDHAQAPQPLHPRHRSVPGRAHCDRLHPGQDLCDLGMCACMHMDIALVHGDVQ
jgi:hypothetical protein